MAKKSLKVTLIVISAVIGLGFIGSLLEDEGGSTSSPVTASELDHRVEGVYCGWWGGIRGATGNYHFYQWITVLMNDGWGTWKLDIPFDDMDVAQSRRDEPERWFRWRKRGGTYHWHHPEDQEWQEMQLRSAIPAAPGEILNRSVSYQQVHGSSFAVQSFASGAYTFMPDGRYNTSSGRFMATGSLSGLNNASGYSATRSDEQGTRSSGGARASGTVASSSSQQGDGAGNRGQYRFDGYSLELTADNGNTERFAFAFCGDKSRVQIGTQFYSLDQPSVARSLPRDWSVAVKGADLVYHVPDDLRRGEVFKLILGFPYDNAGESPEAHLRAALEWDQLTLGEATIHEQKPVNEQVYQMVVVFPRAGARPRMIGHYLVSRQRDDKVQVLRLVYSDQSMFQRYSGPFGEIVRAMTRS